MLREDNIIVPPIYRKSRGILTFEIKQITITIDKSWKRVLPALIYA